MTTNFVCPNCVTSGLWKDKLRAESDVIGSCTYCNSSDVENLEDFELGVPIETFINMVEEAINERFTTTEDEDIYPDSVDGDIPIEHFSTEDVLNEVLVETIGVIHDEIIEEVSNSFEDTFWIRSGSLDNPDNLWNMIGSLEEV